MQYGLTLNTKYQPFYPPYLDKMCAVIRQALRVHPRTLAVRMVLWPGRKDAGTCHVFMEAPGASLSATGWGKNKVDYLWTRDFIMWSFFWGRIPSGVAFLNLPGSPPLTACFVMPGVKRSDWSISRCMAGRVTISFC